MPAGSGGGGSVVKKRCKCCCKCRKCYDTGGYYQNIDVQVSGFDSSRYWLFRSSNDNRAVVFDLNGTYTLENVLVDQVFNECNWTETTTTTGDVYRWFENTPFATPTLASMLVGNLTINLSFVLRLTSTNWQLEISASVGGFVMATVWQSLGVGGINAITFSFSDCKTVGSSTETWEYYKVNPSYHWFTDPAFFAYDSTDSVSVSVNSFATWVPCGLNESGGAMEETSGVSGMMAMPEPMSARIPLRTVRCLYLGRRIETVGCCDGGRRHECDKGRPAVPGEYCQACPDYEPDGDAGW
jgi:hypothetical protein